MLEKRKKNRKSEFLPDINSESTEFNSQSPIKSKKSNKSELKQFKEDKKLFGFQPITP